MYNCLQLLDYKSALVKAYQFYGSQMIGKVDPSLVPPWRSDALLYEQGPPSLEFGNLSGGFIAGSTPQAQAGSVKLTLPTAYSIAKLAWAYLTHPQVWLLPCNF